LSIGITKKKMQLIHLPVSKCRRFFEGVAAKNLKNTIKSLGFLVALSGKIIRLSYKNRKQKNINI